MKKTVSLLTAFLLVTGIASAVPEFLQPIDQTSGDKQQQFGSSAETDGENLWFEAQLDNVPSDGDLVLYRKDLNSKSFTSVDTVSADTDYSSQDYHFNVDAQQSLSVGESYTWTIDGQEHTIKVDGVQSTTQVSLEEDGVLDNYYLGDDIYTEGDSNTPITIREIVYTGDSQSTVTFETYNRLSVPEGEYTYRVEYQPDDSYSDRIYTVVDQATQTPYLINTTSDGQRIRDFNRKTVSFASSIQGFVAESEDDNYNVSLYNDDTGALVGYSEKDGDTVLIKAKGLLYDLYNFFGDSTSQGTHSFVTAGSDLHTDGGFDDNYYFEIEDLADGRTRTTSVFQTTTSGTNYYPNVTALEGYNGTQYKPLTSFTDYGEPLDKIRVSVDDANNADHAINLSVTSDYTGDVQLSRAEADNVFDHAGEINRSGDWTAKVNVTDGDKFEYTTYNWSVEWGNLTTEYYVENSSGQFTQSNVTHNTSEYIKQRCSYTCVGGECRVNQSEETKCWNDPQKVSDTSQVKSEEQSMSALESFVSWLLGGL